MPKSYDSEAILKWQLRSTKKKKVGGGGGTFANKILVSLQQTYVLPNLCNKAGGGAKSYQ